MALTKAQKRDLQKQLQNVGSVYQSTDGRRIDRTQAQSREYDRIWKKLHPGATMKTPAAGSETYAPPSGEPVGGDGSGSGTGGSSSGDSSGGGTSNVGISIPVPDLNKDVFDGKVAPDFITSLQSRAMPNPTQYPGAASGAYNNMNIASFAKGERSPNTGGSTGQSPMGSDPLSSSNSMWEDLYKRNTEGSLQSFNRASNRLRDRLESAGAGQADATNSAMLGRGFGASGANDRAQEGVRNGVLDAYGQGLVGLESEFEKNRLTGLNQAANSAAGLANESQYARDLAEKQAEFGSNFDLQKAGLEQSSVNSQANAALQQWLAQLGGSVDLEKIASNERLGSSSSIMDLISRLFGGGGAGSAGSSGAPSGSSI